jgi:hypothetical protein
LYFIFPKDYQKNYNSVDLSSDESGYNKVVHLLNRTKYKQIEISLDAPPIETELIKKQPITKEQHDSNKTIIDLSVRKKIIKSILSGENTYLIILQILIYHY